MDDIGQDTPLLAEDRGIDPDAAFGGTHARKELEARLLTKLDTRMSILVAIYVLNCGSMRLGWPWIYATLKNSSRHRPQ